ncbi:DUF1345 domain-containing protein [Limnohabitans sp.]|uniref:DUF1345 domain-containing protein n=1 Tax=Limnohabitans sp. TaxID=1907725 RepID=UPI0035B20C79
MKHPLRILLRQTRARVRLVTALAFGLGLFLMLPVQWPSVLTTRLLLCWNATVLLYLVMALWVVATSSLDTLRQRAYRQDEGQKTILLLTAIAVLASLVAIVAELGTIKSMGGSEKMLHLGLAASTVASSWLFMHLMFAMHYAHDYYLSGRRGQVPGLAFPNEDAPDYWDFLYFSAVIGTSGQTADVSFTSKAMRRTGLLHCVLAYFYNTTVLALTINIAASLM